MHPPARVLVFSWEMEGGGKVLETELSIIPTHGTLSNVVGNLVAVEWKMISGAHPQLLGSQRKADSETNHPSGAH